MRLHREYISNLSIIKEYRRGHEWDLLQIRLSAINAAYIEGDLSFREFDALLTCAFTGEEVNFENVREEF